MTASAQPPSGTVTFLMTDIEASTRQWVERADEMAATIARHYELLADAVEANGGYRPVEQGEGDSLVAVFPSALAGVKAAAAAQHALVTSLEAVRVRMALHTADAQPGREPTYSGVGVIRCARLRSCAHGGQVLLSDTTATVVREDLPDDLTLVDLGTARLQGLPHPERVWQLDPPGLATSFPPLRCLDRTPHNLPARVSSIVGREHERGEIAALLSSHRLVALIGVGGAGKTRLALECAHELLDRHRGGTWWVDLSDLGRPDLVLERFAHAIGVRSVGRRDPRSSVVRELRDVGEVLVVIDNAEHLMDAVSTVVSTVLNECPDARLLVTSREQLVTAGGIAFPVGSLTPADAARLFAERALAARPHLDVERADHAQLVVSICTRLDRLPLAIELAAARARTLPLAHLARGLDDTFRLLVGGARTAVPRQQTLAASIAWSVDLLDDRDQSVFRSLAVFAGSFDIEAAEAVAADGETVHAYDVLDALGRLVDKSLVVLDEGDDRYRLLETLRQWGLEALRTSGELATTRTRHALWCARWAEDVAALRYGVDTEPLLQTVPDVRTAIEWAATTEPAVVMRLCAALGRRLALLGPSTCHTLFDWIHDAEPDDGPLWAAAVDALVSNAFLHERTDVLRHVPRAIELLGDDRPGVALRLSVHMPGVMAGDYAVMAELCAAAIADGDEWNAAWLGAAVARFASAMGHLDVARTHLELLAEMLRAWHLDLTPDDGGYGFATAVDLAMLDGELGRASAIASTSWTGVSEATFAAALNVSVLGLARDDPALLGLAARWVGQEPPARFLGAARAVPAVVALHAGDVRAAADHARAWRQVSAPLGAMRVLEVVPVAVALLSSGDVDAAGALRDEWARDVASYGDLPRPLASVHHITAMVAMQQGRLTDAIRAAHELLDVATRHTYVPSMIDALVLLTDLAARRANGQHAARLAGATTIARERVGYQRPLVVDPSRVDEVAARLQSEHPTEYSEGATLELADAVHLARRMRGQRGRPAFGWESLTPTERVVTELAVTGLTNAQVAERLGMRSKTVKTHLTRIFTKLAVQNRTELAHAYARRSERR